MCRPNISDGRPLNEVKKQSDVSIFGPSISSSSLPLSPPLLLLFFPFFCASFPLSLSRSPLASPSLLSPRTRLTPSYFLSHRPLFFPIPLPSSHSLFLTISYLSPLTLALSSPSFSLSRLFLSFPILRFFLPASLFFTLLAFAFPFSHPIFLFASHFVFLRPPFLDTSSLFLP